MKSVRGFDMPFGADFIFRRGLARFAIKGGEWVTYYPFARQTKGEVLNKGSKLGTKERLS